MTLLEELKEYRESLAGVSERINSEFCFVCGNSTKALDAIISHLERTERLVEGLRKMDVELIDDPSDDTIFTGRGMKQFGSRLNERWRSQRDAILKEYDL